MIVRSRRRHARGSSAVLGLLMALCVTAAGAQPPAEKLVGDWFLTLEERNATHTGILTIEGTGGALAAFVDGGPAAFELADGTIELTFDTRDGGGRLLGYALKGRVEGGSLRGELTPPLDAPKGSWHAERHAVPHAAPPTKRKRQLTTTPPGEPPPARPDRPEADEGACRAGEPPGRAAGRRRAAGGDGDHQRPRHASGAHPGGSSQEEGPGAGAVRVGRRSIRHPGEMPTPARHGSKNAIGLLQQPRDCVR